MDCGGDVVAGVVTTGGMVAGGVVPTGAVLEVDVDGVVVDAATEYVMLSSPLPLLTPERSLVFVASELFHHDDPPEPLPLVIPAPPPK